MTATDGGWRPQEKDKLSDKPTVRYRASAGRQTLESKCVCVWEGVGGSLGQEKMGIGEENESRGNRQQMNLHLCSQASWDIGENTSQTAAEVPLRPHTSCGFYPSKETLRYFPFLRKNAQQTSL